MRIPASTVVDVNIDMQCLDVECKTLPNVLQAIVDSLCSSELPSLDFKCLSPVETVPQFYQLVIDRLCSLSVPDVPTVYNFESCLVDTWVCGATACIPGTDLESTVQALIARVNRLSNIISNQCNQIELLESRINQLTTQVDNIKDCC